MADNNDKNKRQFFASAYYNSGEIGSDMTYDDFINALKSNPNLIRKVYAGLEKAKSDGRIKELAPISVIENGFGVTSTPTTTTETEASEVPGSGGSFPTMEELNTPISNQPLPNTGGIGTPTNQPKAASAENQIAPLNQQAGQVQGGMPQGQGLGAGQFQITDTRGAEAKPPVASETPQMAGVQPQVTGVSGESVIPVSAPQSSEVNPYQFGVTKLGEFEAGLIGGIGSELRGISELGYSIDSKIVNALKGTPLEGSYSMLSKPEDSWIYQAGKGLENFAEKDLYRNPQYAGGLTGTVATALGQVGSIMMQGGLNPAGGIMKLGRGALTNRQLIANGAKQLFGRSSIAGGFQMVGAETQAARQLHKMANSMDKDAYVLERVTAGENAKDAGDSWESLRNTTEDEVASSIIPTALFAGSLEAIPLERLMARLGKPVTNVVIDAFKQGGVQGAEEAIQETLQQVVLNAGIGQTYNEAQRLTNGLYESAEGGGATGFVLGAVLTALTGKRAKVRQQVQNGEISQQEAISELEDINKAETLVQDKLQALDNQLLLTEGANRVAGLLPERTQTARDKKAIPMGGGGTPSSGQTIVTPSPYEVANLPEAQTYFNDNKPSETNPLNEMTPELESIFDKIADGVMVSSDALHGAYQWANGLFSKVIRNNALSPAEKGATLNILSGMLADIDKANTEGQKFVDEVEAVSVQDRVPAVREGVKPLPAGQEPKGQATITPKGQGESIRQARRVRGGVNVLPSSGEVIVTPQSAQQQLTIQENETGKQEVPMLEGVRDGGNQGQVGQESTQLRPQEAGQAQANAEGEVSKGLPKEVAELYSRRATLEFTLNALSMQMGNKPLVGKAKKEYDSVKSEIDSINSQISEYENRNQKSEKIKTPAKQEVEVEDGGEIKVGDEVEYFDDLFNEKTTVKIIAETGTSADGLKRYEVQYPDGKFASVWSDKLSKATPSTPQQVQAQPISVKTFRVGKQKGDFTFSSITEDYANEYGSMMGFKDDAKEHTVEAKNPLTVEMSSDDFTDYDKQLPILEKAKADGHDLVIFRPEKDSQWEGEEFYVEIKQPQQVQGQPKALADVESTAKALEGVEKESLEKALNIIGETLNKKKAKIDVENNSAITSDGKQVRFRISKTSDTEIGQDFLTITAIDNDGKKVGYAKFLDNGNNNLEGSEVEVPSKFQKQGIASAIYSFADAKGYKVKESILQTPEGRALWNSLKTNEGSTKSISEAYHKAKADGSNPELVKAVEELLTPKENAVQIESTAEVPVQPKAGVSPEVAEGKPEAKPESPAQQGQGEATATEAQGEVEINKRVQIPELNSSYIVTPISESDPFYKSGYRYLVTHSYPENLGEMGNYNEFWVKTIPTKQDIINSINDEIKFQIDELSNQQYLSGRDENILAELNKIGKPQETTTAPEAQGEVAGKPTTPTEAPGKTPATPETQEATAGEVDSKFASEYGISVDDVTAKLEEKRKVYDAYSLSDALKDLGVTAEKIKQAIADYTNIIITKILPTKTPTKKQKLESEYLKEGEINIQPVPKKLKSVPSTSTTNNEILVSIALGEKDNRYYAIHNNAEAKEVVATDALVMVIIKDDSINETINKNPDTGKKEDSIVYPKYRDIIPTKFKETTKQNAQELYNSVNGVDRATKMFDSSLSVNENKIPIRLKFGDSDVFVVAGNLLRALDPFVRAGIKDIEVKFTGESSKPIIITGGNIEALVMPVMMEGKGHSFKTLIDTSTKPQDQSTPQPTLSPINATDVAQVEKIENAPEKGRELALAKPTNKELKRAFDNSQDLSDRARKAGIYDGKTLKIGGQEITLDTPAKFKAFLLNDGNYKALSEAVKDVKPDTKQETIPEPTPKQVKKNADERMEDAKSTFVFPIGLNPKFKFDVRLPKKVVNFFKEYFRPQGLFTKELFGAKRRNEARIASQSERTKYKVKDLYSAIKKAYPKGVTTADVERMNDFLQGNPVELPPALYKPLEAMREHIDELSKLMIREGIIDEKLVPVFDANMGIYTTRTYKIHNDPETWMNYIANTPEGQQLRNNAVNWLREQYEAKADRIDEIADKAEAQGTNLMRRAELSETSDPEQARKYEDRAEALFIRAENLRAKSEALRQGDFDAKIDAFLHAESMPLDIVKKGNVGAKDLGILKKRSDIDEVMRMLMGEEKDPITNYMMSVAKMSALISNNQFLNEAKVQGLKDGTFTKDERGKNIEKIASEGTESMNPLNGLYTTPEIAQAFKEYGEIVNSPWYIDSLLRINGFIKMNKTLLSQQTHIRNFTSNPIIELANGAFRIGKLKESALSQYENIFGLPEGERRVKYREYIERLTKLGVLDQGANYRDALSFYEDMKGGKFDYQKVIEPKLTKLGKTTFGKIKEAYKAEDDFWKVYAFENERATLKEAYGDTKTDQELDEMAAEKVLKTRINYNMSPKIIQAIKRIPFLGTFPTFPAEIIRITANIPQVAVEEMKSGNKVLQKQGAKRMAGFMAAMVGVAGLNKLINYALGMDDEEEEARKKFLAPWSQNSTLIWLSKDSYIDTGYSDAFNVIKKPLVALARGTDLASGGVDALLQAIDPFVSEEIGYKTIESIKNNRDEYDNPIYDESASPTTKFYQVLSFALKKSEPGALTQIKRAYKGETGELAEKGQKYNTFDEILNATTGQKTTTIDWDNAILFKLKAEVEKIKDSNSFYNKANRQLNKDDVQGRKDQAEITNLAVEQSYNNLVDYYKSAQTIGYKPQQIVNMMKDAGASTDIIQSIVYNKPYKNYLIILEDGTVLDRDIQRKLRQ